MKPIFSVVVMTAILVSIRLVSGQVYSNQQPEAPTVTAAQIRTLRGDNKNDEQVLLVDVREKIETDVSMIPGAVTQAEFEETYRQHLGKVLIVYCTVGHRSEIYAQKLRQKGWDARNYKGSILDWCNRRLQVVTRSGQATNRVHTYSSRYALASGYEAVY